MYRACAFRAQIFGLKSHTSPPGGIYENSKNAKKKEPYLFYYMICTHLPILRTRQGSAPLQVAGRLLPALPDYRHTRVAGAPAIPRVLIRYTYYGAILSLHFLAGLGASFYRDPQRVRSIGSHFPPSPPSPEARGGKNPSSFLFERTLFTGKKQKTHEGVQVCQLTILNCMLILANQLSTCQVAFHQIFIL